MKHAFLIMAHENSQSFQTLLKQLDSRRIDVFIHMDIKNKQYKAEQTTSMIKNANVFHTDRIDVSWAGFSQIKAELLLLKLAAKTGQYDYYHLLSGQDLLITNLDEMFAFFGKHQGKEFVNFESDNFRHQNRVKYYSIQDYIGRKKALKPLKLLNKVSIGVQEKLKVNRNAHIIFRKGDNWFSITDSLARYVIDKEDWIYKVFKNTDMGDELFLQTIVHNSPFKHKLYLKDYDNNHLNILREIDWERGMPYTYRVCDLQELINSPNFFARKFSEKVDADIIQEIYARYH